MRAYLRAEFLIKVVFLTRPFAGVALPAAGQATPERPTAAPWARRPPTKGGPVRWALRAAAYPPPLRGRAAKVRKCFIYAFIWRACAFLKSIAL